MTTWPSAGFLHGRPWQRSQRWLQSSSPSFRSGVKRPVEDPAAVLTKDEFRETVRSIASMMQESAVLKSDEQDQLGVAFANLEMASALYDSPLFTGESAKNTLALVDGAVAAIERRGLLHGAVEKPWTDRSPARIARYRPPVTGSVWPVM